MSFLKRIFGNKLVDKLSSKTNPEMDAPGNTLKPGSGVVDESQRMIVKFHEDFAVSFPKNAQKCSICLRATYLTSDQFAKLLIPERRSGDKDFIKNAQKTFLMLEGADCTNCGSHLCWECVVKDAHFLGSIGAGEGYETCPKCYGKINAHPSHNESADIILNDGQKAAVIKVLLISRENAAYTPYLATITVGNMLVTIGWDGVSAYLGRCYASLMTRQIENGVFSEAKLKKDFFDSA